MEKEKELIKKIIKYSIMFFSSSFLILTLLIGSLAMAIFQINSSKNNNSHADIGAGGVPAEFVQYFNEASDLTGIPNWVLAGIAKQESNFNPNDSYGGAYGIMQQQRYDCD